MQVLQEFFADLNFSEFQLFVQQLFFLFSLNAQDVLQCSQELFVTAAEIRHKALLDDLRLQQFAQFLHPSFQRQGQRRGNYLLRFAFELLSWIR